MYETWHILASYVAGTVGGLLLFRMYIKERIITMTIDTLVENEYVRSYEDEHGMVHLHKWHEIEDILEQIRHEKEEEEKHETNDSP
jgi:DNA-binding MarR family transcriptional regulator